MRNSNPCSDANQFGCSDSKFDAVVRQVTIAVAAITLTCVIVGSSLILPDAQSLPGYSPLSTAHLETATGLIYELA